MQEGTLTWSLRRNSLPLPALRAQGPVTAGPGPSGRIAFWRLIFASFFVIFFCIVFSCFFDGFGSPFWLHVGIIFHVFCMIVSSIDSTLIFHQFCEDFFMFVEVFVLFSMDLHPIGESFKNICFYFTFA